MGRFVALLLLALLAVAEVGAIMLIVDAVGPANALVLLALDVAVGVMVMRSAIVSSRDDRGWRLAAGAFIALPGFVLDLVGLALLLPGVRRWAGSTVLRSTEAAMRRRGMTVVTVTDSSGRPRHTVVPGDVVPGAVVDDSDDDSAARGDGQSGPVVREDGQTGPGVRRDGPTGPVVRGELAGPDEPQD